MKIISSIMAISPKNETTTISFIWIMMIFLTQSSHFLLKDQISNMFMSMIIILMMMMNMLFTFNNFFKKMPNSKNMFKILIISLTLLFLTNEMISFYILFEFSIIPMFIYILSFGQFKKRFEASMFMIIYMFSFSFPFLFFLLSFSEQMNSQIMETIFLYSNNKSLMTMNFFFMMIFLIKLPIFIFHLWLIKAHVQAPIEGSMILASILLKMGGYGLYRFMKMSYTIMDPMMMMILSMSTFYCLISSILMFSMNDLKMMVAYSSIIHMNLFILSFTSFFKSSSLSNMMILMSHSFSSAMFFFLMNTFYQKMNIRMNFLMKGMKTSIPTLNKMWIMNLLINISIPMSANFFSEIPLFLISMKMNTSILILMTTSLIMYSMNIFSIMSFSMNSKQLFSMKKNISTMEILMFLMTSLFSFSFIFMFKTML